MTASRKQFERREILITERQEQDVQADANERYPDLITPSGNKRNFSAAIRDIIDFRFAHSSFFSSWIATRNTTPPEQQS